MHPLLYNIILLAVSSVVFLMLLTAMINLFIRVPYVPSKKRVMRRVIELAGLKPGEKVYDLGCGDGRFLIEAEKRAGIIARGFEIAPIPFLLAHFLKWLNHSKVKISMRNFFKENLRDADVIFCYLGPETLAPLAKKMQRECHRGTRVYSHTFHIEGLKPARVWTRDEKNKMPTIYLYQL